MKKLIRVRGSGGFEPAARPRAFDRVLVAGLGWGLVTGVDFSYEELTVQLDAGIVARVKLSRVLIVDPQTDSPWENAT